jgi:ribosome-binding factor A
MSGASGGSGGVKRATRVAERLREELSLALRGLGDPRVAGALVTRVELTDDLQSAKVYVRHELGAVDMKPLLRGLTAASGKLRKDAAQAMKLRYAPSLRFYYDEQPDAVQRIEELLREVKGQS